MLEKECDIVLKWIDKKTHATIDAILHGIPQGEILRDPELNKTESIRLNAWYILAILRDNGHVKFSKENDVFSLIITSKGIAFVWSGETYVRKKEIVEIENRKKEYDYRNRRWPYIISIGALIVSISGVVLSLYLNQSKKPTTQITILKSQMQSGSWGDTVYRKSVDKVPSKKKAKN